MHIPITDTNDPHPFSDQTARGTSRGSSADLKLFHVTAIANARPILERGLKAGEDGNIYLFSETPVSPWHSGGKETVVEPWVNWELLADCIATSQLDLSHGYVVFAISLDGIVGELEPDRVAERTAPYHRVLRQPEIAPEYLQPLGVVKDDEAEGGEHNQSADAILDELFELWLSGGAEDTSEAISSNTDRAEVPN